VGRGCDCEERELGELDDEFGWICWGLLWVCCIQRVCVAGRRVLCEYCGVRLVSAARKHWYEKRQDDYDDMFKKVTVYASRIRNSTCIVGEHEI
jgi:hypothetical protein